MSEWISGECADGLHAVCPGESLDNPPRPCAHPYHDEREEE